MSNHDTDAVAEVKPGGLLDRLTERAAKVREAKICANCSNLLQVSATALGCAAHDKLILPDFPPYHGHMQCKDWK